MTSLFNHGKTASTSGRKLLIAGLCLLLFGFGLILYSTLHDASLRIMLIFRNIQRHQPITTLTDLGWSMDGTHVTFTIHTVTYPSGSSSIAYAIEVGPGNLNVSQSENPGSPSARTESGWRDQTVVSPDGSRIAFASANATEVYVKDRLGFNQRRIYPPVALRLDCPPVGAGGSGAITATLSNNSSHSLAYSTVLYLNPEAEHDLVLNAPLRQEVMVDAGSERPVTWPIRADLTGIYDVQAEAGELRASCSLIVQDPTEARLLAVVRLIGPVAFLPGLILPLPWLRTNWRRRRGVLILALILLLLIILLVSRLLLG